MSRISFFRVRLLLSIFSGNLFFGNNSSIFEEKCRKYGGVKDFHSVTIKSYLTGTFIYNAIGCRIQSEVSQLEKKTVTSENIAFLQAPLNFVGETT